MVADGTRGEFDAVADNVVLEGEDFERVFFVDVLHAALGHGEGVVGEFDLAVVVELVHGEVDDPAEFKDIRIDEFEAFAKFVADGRADFVSPLELVGNEEHDVAVANPAEFLELS